MQQILENRPLSRPHATGAGISYGAASSSSRKTSWQSTGISGQGEIVQIQPQHLKLQLRPRRFLLRDAGQFFLTFHFRSNLPS